MAKKTVTKSNDKVNLKSFIYFELQKDKAGNLINVIVNRNNINLLEEIGLLQNHVTQLKTAPILTKMFGEHLYNLDKCTNEYLAISAENTEGMTKN